MHTIDKSIKAQSLWETTSRLLATLINEGLVKVSITHANTDKDPHLRIEARDGLEENAQHSILVKSHEGISCDGKMAKPSLPLLPEDLLLPMVVETQDADIRKQSIDLDPGMLFELVFSWLGYDSACKPQIVAELRSSARFQGK